MTCENTTETPARTRHYKISLAALTGIVSGVVRAITTWVLEHLLP